MSFALLSDCLQVARAENVRRLTVLSLYLQAPLDYDCSCFPPNTTFNDGNITFPNLTDTVTTVTSLLLGDNSTSGEMFNVTDVNATDLGVNWTSLTKAMCKVKGGVLHGTGCDTPEYKADVFFLSLILFCGTYIIASSLSDAKTSSFFPSVVSFIK